MDEATRIMVQAENIAAKIEEAAGCESVGVVFLAVALVIGRQEARSPQPDFHGMLRAMSEASFDAFRNERRRLREEASNV